MDEYQVPLLAPSRVDDGDGRKRADRRMIAAPVSALAQDNILATATLPRDLSPWDMYINADPVVKAVLIGPDAARRNC